jgi:hypothetical protein
MGEIAPFREGETLAPDSFVADGDVVVILGTEHWTYVPAGESVKDRFTHHYRFEGGKIVLFEDSEPAGAELY